MSTCIAIEATGCEPEKLSLQDVMGDDAAMNAQHSRFVDMIQNAVGTALAPPRSYQASSDRMASSSLDWSGNDSGQSGKEKGELVSNALSSDSGADMDSKEQEHFDRVVGMINDLNINIANYQVAWKIAERIQQDTSHIMKG